ncbi:hypothetical protein TCAL_08731 [Tigriopus californicus]|uniref:G-protein coupled receptors family 1 profile domain-containing protein n=1 Tax=Tigriopus californicus TaxID=6832 RepID=A0A553P5M8_TIGCA|nr:FMRFamide receptor-like [Tigriopus californicus]TRY72989.1 hypothetical protein TCAL_08731 [Tigriopus californicus]|eukprot:TCALIF_08731-PA protein Name:"Similar to FR FMRFamide receptor (Drosophila melanogaster)" AED:0.08 eAED:0.08 QI:0/-1/0/1/-1/1/1/0/492
MEEIVPSSSSFVVSLNSTNETSVDEETLTFIVEGVILTIVSTFGLIGNVMSIFVLMRVQNVQKSFSNLLLGLACFDALFLLTAILAFGLPKLSGWYERKVFLPIMALTFGLLHTFRVGSVYVTLSVNFERFYAIVFPLKHFFWKKYLLPAAVIFTVVYNLPKYFDMHIVHDEATNTSVIVSTEMRRNPLYMSLYVFWSKFILIEIIPYFMILVCNTFIICKITKSAQFRKRFHAKDKGGGSTKPSHATGASSSAGMSFRRSFHTSVRADGNGPRRTFLRKQKEEHNLGVILIAMSTLFVICQSFKIVPDLYELIWCTPAGSGGECQFDTVTSGIIRISHLLVCFNSAANFLIYYLSGQKFRLAWLHTYGPCFGYKPRPDEMGLQQSFYHPSGSVMGDRVSRRTLSARNNEPHFETETSRMGSRRSPRLVPETHRLLDQTISFESGYDESPSRHSTNGLLNHNQGSRNSSIKVEIHGGKRNKRHTITTNPLFD